MSNTKLMSFAVGMSAMRATPVCSVNLRRYLEVEPTVIWVQPEYTSVTHVHSNTNWRIE